MQQAATFSYVTTGGEGMEKIAVTACVRNAQTQHSPGKTEEKLSISRTRTEAVLKQALRVHFFLATVYRIRLIVICYTAYI